MSQVTGAAGTLSVTQGQRALDISDKVLELEPSAAPLTVLTKKLKKRASKSPKITWFEEELRNRVDLVNGAIADTTTTAVVVDTGTKFFEHDVVLNTTTGEVMRVTGVSSNTLTVVRGLGSTAANIGNDDQLIVIGSAQPEGDTAKDSRLQTPTAVDNYTQIFREPIEMTETLRSSDMVTKPHEWPRKVRIAGIEHMKDIELAGWHGVPTENTTGSQPRRTTGGFYHFHSTNAANASGQLTEAEFWAGLAPIFRYGNSKKERVGFAGGLVISIINGYPQANIQTVQGADTYGLRVFRYISAHGTLNLITHWLFSDTTEYAKHLAVLDMDNCGYVYLNGGEGDSRDTQLLKDRQANDADAKKYEWLTECGFEFGLDKTHGIIYGITS